MEITRPEDVGLSTPGLARITNHLERHYVVPAKIAGCLTIVARKGHIVHCEAQGSMDLEREKPMREDVLFRIYSMSKPITSVAMMMLVEEGSVQLTDPVHRFIPEWKNLRVYESGNHPRFVTRRAERPMTIADLLTHTAGLTYGFMERTNVDAAYRKLGILGRTDGPTLRDMIEGLAELPLEFSPGTSWNYSVATDVLGYLVQTISGQPYDRFLQNRILGPLGMTDTGFTVPDSERERFAACYGRTRSKRLVLQDDPEKSVYCRDVTLFSGGGGLVSTAHDYLRFCTMLLRGGELDGARILGPRTIDYMTKNHLPEDRDLTQMSVGAFSETKYEGTGFGLGFSVVLDPVAAKVTSSSGEFAWGGAASTAFFIDPKEELIVIFLTQLMPSATFNFRGQIKQIVYGSLID
ncbi:MAG: serine hydrolase [Candidatus Binatia bacterium]|nr:serine hydrolase [Candidatus Binatia bacterium]